ncbi:MAG: cob(I)yrinic acid a,c-diamide adenosyltransferase [Victivallales bacterium]|jgi:cob(I)alamin adenosyltransferase|nr:cob(I)yrinic acid a,c-diamide adenosyltransferase [Victivallales bacterium]
MLNEKDRGLLLNLTGDGKGKSSSAFGVAIRAIGWGWSVAVLQFIKNDRPTGERNFFTTRFPEMIFECCGLGLTTKPGDHAGMARRGWERGKELLNGFEGELLILDELNIAIRNGYLDPAEVAQVLRKRKCGLNVIVTGRGICPEIAAISDLISEIKDVRHPYREGVKAQKGLDY